MTPESIRPAAIEAGLNEHRIQQLIEATRPCIFLIPTSASDEMPVGQSQMGGLPDLAPDQEWPMWNGKPQSFIAQINLAEVHSLPGSELLPPSGLLSFFYDSEQSTWGYDPKHADSFRVLHTESKDLRRVSPPGEISEEAIFSPCRLSFQPGITLLPWASSTFNRLSFNEKELDLFIDLSETLTDKDEWAGHSFLLGHPDLIQGDMEQECACVTGGLYMGDLTGWNDPRYTELAKNAPQWRLLLQVVSEEAAGMMWGDLGCLYYWIREDDLRERRFDKVWMILQCS